MVLGVGGLWVGLGCSQCVAERPWGAIAAALTAEGSPWSSVVIVEVGGAQRVLLPRNGPWAVLHPSSGVSPRPEALRLLWRSFGAQHGGKSNSKVDRGGVTVFSLQRKISASHLLCEEQR